jgi:hypothetical protein
MADQDFNINIRINANTAQVDAIRQSFEKLGAQVQVTNAQAAAGGGIAGGDLGRLVGGLTGVGLGSSIYAFVDGLKRASAEIAKISEDLDKQGAQLVENAQLFGVQAKHATDAADVIKISDAALKEMAATQKTLNDLSEKELGYAAKVSDYLQTQMLARQRQAGMGDYEAASQENLKTAVSQAAAAQAAAIKEIDDAQDAQQRGIEEIISDTQRAIELEQKHADTARAANDAVEYAKAVNALNKYNQELEKAIKLREQQHQQQQKEDEATAQSKQEDIDFVQQQVKRASPQARAALMNEQAAQLARDQGRQRDADLFQQSADRFKQFATPGQKEEIGVLEKLVEQTGILREIRDSWK